MSYFDGPKSSKNWYARLEYSYTQSASATTITLTLKVYDATGYSYNGDTNSAYYIIQGEKTYQTYSFGSAGWYSIGSKTITVSDTSTTSLDVSAIWCSDNESTYTPYSLSVSGTITFPQISPSSPDINTISVQPIPELIAGYDGDEYFLNVIPSGGTGYTYKWYRGTTNIGTSQNLTGTLSNSSHDNTFIYCIVTDSRGRTAITNKCEVRVGTSASQTQVSTHQIEPVRFYNGSRFLYGIPFLYNSSWKYGSWNITYTGNNRANIAVAGKAIVG